MSRLISTSIQFLKRIPFNYVPNTTFGQQHRSRGLASNKFYKVPAHRALQQQFILKNYDIYTTRPRATSVWTYIHTSSILMKIETVKVPGLADSISEGDIKFSAKVGDHVSADQVVMEIETDKTSVPVPAPFAGVITEILVKDGDTVKPSQELFKIQKVEGGAAPIAPKPTAPTPSFTAAAPKPTSVVSPKPAKASPKPAAVATSPPTTSAPPKPAAVATSPPPPTSSAPPKPAAVAASPPPPTTSATPKPKAAVAPASAFIPKAATSTIKIPPRDYSREIVGTRSEQRVKMNRMRLKIAARLKEAQNVNASLTTFNEIDMSSAMTFRKDNLKAFTEKYKTKIGYVSMFAKAAAFALQDQPVINAVIEGTEIVYRDYIDISIAVATPKGLVVPVIRNVESLNYADVEIALAALGDKARKGKISVEDMDGGTFTISNGGVFGSLIGTPIINPPQSSILGMHGIFERPVAIKKQIVIRPMMYVALTYDHRLIDGREAVLFLRKIKSAVEDPRIMLAGL